jgi:recombination protein RecR
VDITLEFGSELLRQLVDEFAKLPSIGRKTAMRLALFLLNHPEQAEQLAHSILAVKERVGTCAVCGHVAEGERCDLCADVSRDDRQICVVEQPSDVLAIERTAEYRGRYHVLRGAISPLDGIGPDDLRVKELLSRIPEGRVEEVILATNPNAAGEATALYIARLVSPLGIRVTRIARGLPVGSDLEYSDQSTLASALDGRQDM